MATNASVEEMKLQVQVLNKLRTNLVLLPEIRNYCKLSDTFLLDFTKIYELIQRIEARVNTFSNKNFLIYYQIFKKLFEFFVMRPVEVSLLMLTENKEIDFVELSCNYSTSSRDDFNRIRNRMKEIATELMGNTPQINFKNCNWIKTTTDTTDNTDNMDNKDMKKSKEYYSGLEKASLEVTLPIPELEGLKLASSLGSPSRIQNVRSAQAQGQGTSRKN